MRRQFDRVFGAVNLSQMKRFYLAWPPQQTFQTLSEKSLALPELVAKFPLPSAYIRLLSVKAPMPEPSMKLRLNVSAGRFDRQAALLEANPLCSRQLRQRDVTWKPSVPPRQQDFLLLKQILR